MRDQPIASDDPLAKEKLTERIASLVAIQERMTEANKIVRKHKVPTDDAVALLVAIGLSEGNAKLLFAPDYAGRIGFAPYELTNNGQNIKRLQRRLATLMEHANDDTKDEEVNGIVITDNVEAHRVQIHFKSKPSERVRSFLKSCGFRWAPSIGVWQAHRSERALWRAREACKLDAPDSNTVADAPVPNGWTHIETGCEVASDEATPLDVLRHHVTGAIERGEAQPIIEQRELVMAACASTPMLG